MNTRKDHNDMEYINRRRETYFAFQGSTKTGKPKYFASKKPTSEKADRVEALPAEFEFYENPANATVVIRRRKATKVTVSERNLLDRLCLEHCKTTCQTVIDGDRLVVYAAPKLGGFGGSDQLGILSKFAQQSQNLSAELRFTLRDEKRRLFSVDRYCYRGPIDGWMDLHRNPSELQVLAVEMIPHLGQDSFYELF